MSDPVWDFVERVSSAHAEIVEAWLRAHVSHSAAPPQIVRRAGVMDMRLSCECGRKLRVWVETTTGLCTVRAEQS